MVKINNKYKTLLNNKVFKSLSIFAAIARMPGSMMSSSVIILIASIYHNYSIAGTIIAIIWLSFGFAIPITGRYIDRNGYVKILAFLLSISTVSFIIFQYLVSIKANSITLYLAAIVIGVFLPITSGVMRTLWGRLYHHNTSMLKTAYAYESVIDEIIFIVGPIIATVLCTNVNPYAGINAMLLFFLCGIIGLNIITLKNKDKIPVNALEDDSKTPLKYPMKIFLILIIELCAGIVFGCVDITTIAFASFHHVKEYTGLMLALYALSSCISGIIFGSVDFKKHPGLIYLMAILFFELSLLPLPYIHNSFIMASMLFISGFTVSPILISSLSLIKQYSKISRLTEMLSWSGMCMNVGVMLGSVISGFIIDQYSASFSYNLAIFAGACALIIAWVFYFKTRDE